MLIARTATVNTAILLLICSAAVLLYFPALSGPFILDDFWNLSRLTMTDLSLAELRHLLTGNESGYLSRPVSTLTFGLSYYLQDGSSLGYKATNLVLHIGNGVLVFLLTQTILNTLHPNSGNHQIALLVTAIWLIHPIQVSTVLYVVQRMTQLAALFVLLGLYLYLLGRERIIKQRRYGLTLLLLSLWFCMPTAALSKENGVLLPVFILLCEWCIRPHEQSVSYRRINHFLLGSVLPIIVLGGLFFLINIEHFLEGYRYRAFTLSERLATELVIMGDYLSMILLPTLNKLTFLHDNTQIYSLNHWLPWFYLTVHTTVIGLALHCRCSRPLISLGILFFYTGHLIESSVLPLELMWEHRNYLPALGVLLTCAQLWIEIRQHHTAQQRHIIPIALILLGTLAISTHLRATSWQTNAQLVSHWYQVNPESCRAASMLAIELKRQGKLQQSTVLMERCLREHPEEISYLFQIIGINCKDPLIVSHYLQLHAPLTVAISQLRPFIEKLSILVEQDEQEQCRLGTALTPKLAEVQSQIATIATPIEYAQFTHLIGRLALATGDTQQALEAFRHSDQLHEGSILNSIMLGTIYLQIGQYDHAHIIADKIRQHVKDHILTIHPKVMHKYQTFIRHIADTSPQDIESKSSGDIAK